MHIRRVDLEYGIRLFPAVAANLRRGQSMTGAMIAGIDQIVPGASFTGALVLLSELIRSDLKFRSARPRDSTRLWTVLEWARCDDSTIASRVEDAGHTCAALVQKMDELPYTYDANIAPATARRLIYPHGVKS